MHRFSSPSKFPTRSRSGSAAFSLVEVTLAIGIVAFAFVSVFGLLPSGLHVFRSAIDVSVQTQIVQRLVADAQQTDFDTLKNKPVETHYFDDQGNDLGTVATEASIYTVLVTVVPTTQLPADAPPSDNLVTLQIKIARDPARRTDPFALESNLPTSAHAAFIARNKTG